MMKTLWILFATLIVQTCGYRILVVFPMPGKSHGILGEGLVRHVLLAGHQVTYITSQLIKPHPNLEQIDVSDNYDFIPEDFFRQHLITKFSFDLADKQLHMSINIANNTIHNVNVNKLLSDTTKSFDLVIVEWMFSELYAGIPLLYGCPLIWVSCTDPHWLIMSLIDEPTNPAYVPDGIGDKLPPFTFWERAKYLFGQNVMYIIKQTYQSWLERTEYERFFGPLLQKRGKNLPSFDEARYNGSMILANSHVSVGQSLSLPQNYKPVIGYHIQKEMEPLPEHLQKLLDNAKHGVIYFSMGTNMKSTDLAEEIKKNLLKLFSERKEIIIWKFEEDLLNLPKNVHIMKWAPQQSILAHPNCILFITHGGLLSITEAVYYAKPLIGIPVFADQHNNMNRAKHTGYGLTVSVESPNIIEDLKFAIDEILRNPKYAQKAKETSAIYHDRPVPPEKEMLFWIDHVVRTKGAHHLRSLALDMPLYKKLYLDLVLLILLLIICLKVLVTRLLCSTKKKDYKRKFE